PLPALLASGEVPAYVGDLATLLLVGAGIAYVCHRFGLLPLVGFLLTGVAIGPSALGLVDDPAVVEAVAELGVMLLLFTIGIEFSLERLVRMRALIFGGGGLQVVLTTAAAAACLAVFGVDWRTGVYSGFLVALSSTAIVLKVLADRSRIRTEDGRFMVGALILQDIAIVPMVLLVPLLGGAGADGASIGIVLAKSAGIVALVMVVARRLMPPVLERVARTCSPELFLLTVMGICVGTAWMTSLAGLSLSLGAFLAGIVVSESRYSQHALGEVLPIQILFNAAFFMSVGMLLDMRFVAAHWLLVLAAVASILLLKTVAATASARIYGLSGPVALSAGLGLAQVGEFSFVLERAGREFGLAPFGMPESGSQVMIAATVLLMALTPLLLAHGQRVATRRLAAPDEAVQEPVERGHAPPLQNHTVLIGYGPVGRRLQRVLDLTGVPSVVVTLSPVAANEAEAQG
ncbi:MAG TPA: cation:proton antiporter, partial [Planctomycetota bacterium]|nr:cation:proton antiporter [Planctomycetota bacterium]